MNSWRLLAVGAAAVLLATAAPAEPPARRQVLDVGAQWDPYGPYLQRMMAAIQRKWNEVLATSRATPPGGTIVAVQFALDTRGQVVTFLDVGNTSTADGEGACLTALTLAAPFGRWPTPMAEALGSSQEVTVRFYY